MATGTRRSRLRTVVRVGVILTAVVFAGAGPASAHDPVILTGQQTSPAKGPLLMDGTVSFAVYGTITAANDTRGFRIRFIGGEKFVLSALVPDLAPERGFTPREFPTIRLRTPSGRDLQLEAGTVTMFAEPFSKTNYRRYLEWSAPAEAGDYGLSISGTVPSRFTVSVGVQERFGTEVQNAPNRNGGLAGVQQWYATPPPSVSTTSRAPNPTVTSSPSHSSLTEASTSTVPVSDDSSGGWFGWTALGIGLFAMSGAAFFWQRRRSNAATGT